MRARAGAALQNNVPRYPTIMESDDHVYVDISIPYDEEKDLEGFGMPAKYNATLTQSIIDNPSLYHLIIDRWQILGSEIPAYVFDTDHPGRVTLEYNGGSAFADLVYVSDHIPPPTPPPLKPFDQYTVDELRYFFIFTVQAYLDLVNTALATAFAALPSTPVGSNPPRFVFDGKTQLISLYAEKAFYEKSLALPITIYFDDVIQRLLPFFVWLVYPGDLVRLEVSDQFTNTVTIGGVNYLQMEQQSIGMYAFNPAESIVFTSNSIPIKNTYSNINNKDPNNSNASNLAILTDFRFDVQTANDQSKKLLFVSNSNFRRIDLFGTSPLRSLDLQIYWTDKAGNLYPIMLAPSEVASIKLLFIKIGAENA